MSKASYPTCTKHVKKTTAHRWVGQEDIHNSLGTLNDPGKPPLRRLGILPRQIINHGQRHGIRKAPTEGAVYVRLPPLGAWSWSGPGLLPVLRIGIPGDGKYPARPPSPCSPPKGCTGSGKKHAGSLEALRVTRPEAEDLVSIKNVPFVSPTNYSRIRDRGGESSGLSCSRSSTLLCFVLGDQGDS